MHIQSLLSSYSYPAPIKKSRVTERGQLIDEFTARINSESKGRTYINKQGKEVIHKGYSKGTIGFFIGHIKDIQDLHFLHRLCEESVKNGGSYSKTFFWQIKTKQSS